jgi:ABC-type branched-subunit amino acid transport system substrate-binding protein
MHKKPDVRITRTVRLLGVTLITVLFAAGCSVRSYQADDLPLSFRQGEDAFRLGDYERSVRAYRIFLEVGDDKDLVPRAYYKMAVAEFRRGNKKESLEVLDQMQARLPGREWVQVYELRGSVEESNGNDISAIRWFELAWNLAEGDQRAKLYQRIRACVSRLDKNGLVNAHSVARTPEVQTLIDARLRRDPTATAPPPGTNRQRTQPRGVSPQAPPVASGELPPGVEPRIACLVPLSGSYAIYGQRSLNGIRLALGDRYDQLVIKDTHGQLQIARSLFDELVADPSIVAVIGPLRSKVAEGIAPRAQRAALPLILLSQQSMTSDDFVVQPSMTYQRQAAQLAEYATGPMGLSRIAVLYPADGYGSGLAQAFREELEKRNGRIVGSVAYAPGAREFNVELLTADKWMADDALQAVFIPDYAATAVQLGRELRSKYPNLALLGSNGWNDPGRLGQAGGDLDGAVFVDGFFSASRRPATQEFVAAYKSQFSVLPEILEAQGYDAAMLVREALDKGARSRDRVVPTLRGMGAFAGAAGTIRFGPQLVERDLFLLRLAFGSINELGPTAPSLPGAVVSEPLSAEGFDR